MHLGLELPARLPSLVLTGEPRSISVALPHSRGGSQKDLDGDAAKGRCSASRLSLTPRTRGLRGGRRSTAAGASDAAP